MDRGFSYLAGSQIGKFSEKCIYQAWGVMRWPVFLYILLRYKGRISNVLHNGLILIEEFRNVCKYLRNTRVSAVS